MDAHNICPTSIVGEVLHGPQNYAKWRACITSYLSVRDLWYGVVVEGASDPSVILEPWWKRDVSALHAIQISCAPAMLSYIGDKTTAKDAWDTLALKCQPPSMPPAPTQRVTLCTSPGGDLETVKSSGADFHPIFSTILQGKLEIIDEKLSRMSEEDVKVQDSYGCTVLHYAAMTHGYTKIAKILIKKNKDLLTIPDGRGDIPLVSSCALGYKDMIHYLYNMTPSAYLLSPENQTIAALVVCCCIENNLLEVAVDLLRRCPELVVAEASHHGRNAVQVLSCQHSLFLSGSELSFWQRWIYSCLKVKQPEALSSEDDVPINIYEQQDQKETKIFTMQGNGKLLVLWSTLLKFFGIKQIYDLKLTHLYAHVLIRLMSRTIAALDHEQLAQSSVISSIISASQRGTTEFFCRNH